MWQIQVLCTKLERLTVLLIVVIKYLVYIINSLVYVVVQMDFFSQNLTFALFALNLPRINFRPSHILTQALSHVLTSESSEREQLVERLNMDNLKYI